MSRIQVRRLLVPSLVAVCALAACVVNLDFSYTITGQAVSAPNTSAGLNTTLQLDLSGQPDIQEHAGNIKTLSLNSLDLTVSAVQTDNTVQTITGSLYLRPFGVTTATQDVLVGTLTAYPVALNSTVHILGSSALDAFALATVQGSEKFQVVIAGTTSGGTVADFAVDVKLSLSMGYDTGL